MQTNLQVEQHFLLQTRLAVVDGNAVIVPVQAMDESLDDGVE